MTSPSPEQTAAGHDPDTAVQVARSLLLAIRAFTDADDEDALTLLRALRNEVLGAW
ncbi:hypothetical protein [Streptomyces uncialis]|uniref:hypothetical protein n=1 Tax=Streptomyces uncialis TaxID=1048205 RepID=UPI000ADB3EEC|nr:hypothetical protein [Streptomyces uncialis]